MENGEWNRGWKNGGRKERMQERVKKEKKLGIILDEGKVRGE